MAGKAARAAVERCGSKRDTTEGEESANLALTLQRFDGSSCAKRMNLNDLANLGQIIGALAVVISLFYVAHQIRQ